MANRDRGAGNSEQEALSMHTLSTVQILNPTQLPEKLIGRKEQSLAIPN